MNFLQGKLYKKYYPIKKSSVFYEMDEKDLNVLTRWIQNIGVDISIWNMESRNRTMRQGGDLCRQIKITYSKSIKELCLLLKNKQFSLLDKEDLDFVNDVLYRHKYNPIVSLYLFPTRKNI